MFGVLSGLPGAGHSPTKKAAWKNGVRVANINSSYTEISGASVPYKAENSNHLWVIEDGTNANGVRALSLIDATNKGRFSLSSVTTVDGEDLASFMRNGVSYLVVADTGNNSNSSNSRGSGIDISFYRFPEPTITGSDETISSGDIERIDCVFPSGNLPSLKDVECLLADPLTGDLYIITKRISPILCYRLAYASSYTGIQTLEYMGALSNDSTLNTISITQSGNNGYVTGGSISENGRRIVLTNYSRTFVWDRAYNESVYQALSRTYDKNLTHSDPGGGDSCLAPNQLPQREVACLINNDIWMISEYVATEGSSSTRHPLWKLEGINSEPTVYSFQEGINSYAGTIDTYIDTAAPTTDNSASVSLVVDWDGTISVHTRDRQGLLKFDLSSIPSSSTVVGAYLDLYINTEGQEIFLYSGSAATMNGGEFWVNSTVYRARNVTANTFQVSHSPVSSILDWATGHSTNWTIKTISPVKLRIDKDARIVNGQNTAPNSADISPGDVTMWLDPTNGATRLKFTGKSLDGTVKTWTLIPD